MPWLLFATGTSFFWAVGRALKLPRATVGALVLTGALANTLFIGLPMIEPWYGREYQGVGIVIDQIGLTWCPPRWASWWPACVGEALPQSAPTG